MERIEVFLRFARICRSLTDVGHRVLSMACSTNGSRAHLHLEPYASTGGFAFRTVIVREGSE